MQKPIKFETITGKDQIKDAYITIPEGNQAYGGGALRASNGIVRAAVQTNFQNIRPGISGRPGFGREDYEYFRPNEAIPRNYKDMIMACDNLYYFSTLVRNFIDLMSDFACQGIRLVHPVKAQERFYNAWFKKVHGFDRSERFLNYFYRHAMVVIEARTGNLTYRVEREFMSQAEVKVDTRSVKSGELPLQYIFHYPALVNVKNNINADKVIYEVQQLDNNPTNVSIQEIGMVGLTGKYRTLPSDNTFVRYYKRDDWQNFSIPFLYPLIKPAIMLEKLRLADSAALDGAISAVRIFKLGDVENRIAPTEAAVAKLDEILQAHVGGGTMDIIWPGPIELLESKTDVHNFLGEAKYAPHLEEMYSGLGIPPTLAGKGGTGTTNNYISLKTLTKRLHYGRKHLIEFWEEQIKWVQKAMGFARPAKIEFDFFDLGDEATEKALLIQLVDRNLVSDEKIQTLFGYDTEMERARLNRESRERKSGRRVERPTSLNDPAKLAMMKIALQRGYISPEQAGIKVEQGTEKEEAPFDTQMQVMKQKSAQVSAPQKGKKPAGRPTGAKDGAKRKTKVFKPKVKASLDIWANDAQDKINDILKSEYLKNVQKKNFRQLTQNEIQTYEKLSAGVLFQLKPFSEVSGISVANALEEKLDEELYTEYLDYTKSIQKELKRELTFEEKKQIRSIIYTSINEEDNGRDV